MSQQEKGAGFGNHEAYNAESLEKLGDKNREILQEKLERSVESRQEANEANARQEALEKANPIEKESSSKEKREVTHETRRPHTKREKQASYERTMDEVRSQLSAPSRGFSDFIHHPVVEKVSDAVGGTVARPNAILSGSVFAFIFTLAVYLIARLYGYPLSGTETIASFILGWVIGLIYDYIRLLVLGKSE